MEANNILAYDPEANNANQITIPLTHPHPNNEFWCWYVSPDDYIGKNTSISNMPFREVNVKITAEYSSGSPSTRTEKIIIKRPPVILVHGLNSDPSMWDCFANTPEYSGTKFNRYRLKIGGQDSYDQNALAILNTSYSQECSIPGVIKDVRKNNIACNQVYYVGHSMGGIVLRYAETNHADKFFCQANYNKGYVNKFVTLDTPHMGSPFANILESKISLIAYLDRWFDFVSGNHFDEFYSRDYNTGFIVDIIPAIKDLRMNLHHINATAYKSHVFGGDMLYGPENLNYYPVDVIKNLGMNPNLRKVFAFLYPNPFDEGNLNGVDKDYIKYGGTSISNSDLIVPLYSQFSGLSQDNSLTTYTVNFHSAATGSPSIEMNSAAQVAALLDEKISSPVWGYLPELKKSSAKINESSISPNIVLDSNYISILSPHNLDTLYIDSVFNVSFSISDTTNLKKIMVLYQDKMIEDTVLQTNYNYSLSVSNNYIDTQKVVVLALYSVNDSTIISGKTIPVYIKSSIDASSMNSKDNIVYLLNGEYYYPDLDLVYETFMGKIGTVGTAIHVNIANSDILSFNNTTKKFTANKEGETYAVIDYKGLKDTVYFVSYASDIVGIKGDDNSMSGVKGPSNYELVQNYPNPFNPTTRIKYSIPFRSNVRIMIYNSLGQLIKELVNKVQEANTYEIDFNASRYASGVYFYSLNATSVDGKQNYRNTKKMILIK